MKELFESSYLSIMTQENDRLRKELERLQNLIDKTTNYYLKSLSKNGDMPKEAVEMFNLLEGNKQWKKKK